MAGFAFFDEFAVAVVDHDDDFAVHFPDLPDQVLQLIEIQGRSCGIAAGALDLDEFHAAVFQSFHDLLFIEFIIDEIDLFVFHAMGF